MAKNLATVEAFDIQGFLKTAPKLPGVYQMFNRRNDIIYIGKARRLQQRLKSYFQKSQTHPKTCAMVRQIHRIEITLTHSEQEALLLENSLIKKHRPKYNVLFRDDKSYPYIFISKKDTFPRMDFYRGYRKQDGFYFGPYPNAGSVHEALKLLQKLFRLRQCSDTFFSHRTRPCLQYQIKRCTAPCVGYVTPEDYQQDVKDALMFLEGKKVAVLKTLMRRMNEVSERLDFEAAARYRDAIMQLRRMQEQQYVTRAQGEADVLAVDQQMGIVCVQMLMFRSGQLLGSKAYFPEVVIESNCAEILSAFMSQHYLIAETGELLPSKILVNQNLPDRLLLEQVLSTQANRKVHIVDQPRAVFARWLEMAKTNLTQSLKTHLADQKHSFARLEALQDALQLAELPMLMECFDISHTGGEETVASCVCFERGAPHKMRYRRFIIRGVTAGDDYAALTQAISRHYLRLKTRNGILPNLLLIDGGKGQLSAVMAALEELQLTQMCVLAVAKGPERKAGLEKLFMPGRAELHLAPDSPALHLIQAIRDEAHRFAITGHRNRQAKKRVTSPLQKITGIGEQRRRALLQYFGGLQEITQASAEEIAKVPGISLKLAKSIYKMLHEGV